MIVADVELIGKKFKSNSSNSFTVTALTDTKSNRMKLFEIEFDEINGIKYKSLVRKEDIIKGKPRNPFFPSVYGIGYMGIATKKGNDTQWSRWIKMLARCYSPTNPKYKTYGANGVRVCDRWLCFENYLADFSKLEGYDEHNLRNIQLDKDTKIKGNKLYSPETCVFISASENSKEMNRRVTQRYFIATSPEGDTLESNNQREFAKEYGLDYKGINAVLTNRKGQKFHRGWTFKYKEDK